MKYILITGGAGYLGSKLVPSLLTEGHKVVVYDLCLYGEDVLAKHKNLKIVKGDIRDERLLNSNCKNIDVFIHVFPVKEIARAVRKAKIPI